MATGLRTTPDAKLHIEYQSAPHEWKKSDENLVLWIFVTVKYYISVREASEVKFKKNNNNNCISI